MSTIVQIPGGTATLRDPADLTERGRRLMQTALIPLQSLAGKMPASVRKEAQGGAEVNAAQFISTRQEAAAMLEFRDAAVIALLKDWSLDEPLPTIDTLLDLDGETLRALFAGADPFVKDVMAVMNPTDFSPQDPGRDSPFDKSATSAPGSRAGANGSKGRRRTTGVSIYSGDTSAD